MNDPTGFWGPKTPRTKQRDEKRMLRIYGATFEDSQTDSIILSTSNTQVSKNMDAHTQINQKFGTHVDYGDELDFGSSPKKLPNQRQPLKIIGMNTVTSNTDGNWGLTVLETKAKRRGNPTTSKSKSPMHHLSKLRPQRTVIQNENFAPSVPANRLNTIVAGQGVVRNKPKAKEYSRRERLFQQFGRPAAQSTPFSPQYTPDKERTAITQIDCELPETASSHVVLPGIRQRSNTLDPNNDVVDVPVYRSSVIRERNARKGNGCNRMRSTTRPVTEEMTGFSLSRLPGPELVRKFAAQRRQERPTMNSELKLNTTQMFQQD
eukprot:m.135550 g.135550  ORF g.135550 m.135550 type:complete len:320 (+) comp29801_c0_seq1:242-1201(+)